MSIGNFLKAYIEVFHSQDLLGRSCGGVVVWKFRHVIDCVYQSNRYYVCTSYDILCVRIKAVEESLACRRALADTKIFPIFSAGSKFPDTYRTMHARYCRKAT
jgi:hypothetical protein